MSARKRPAQSVSTALPSVLDIGRQIVRLSDSYQAMGEEQTKLCRDGLSSSDGRRRERTLESQMRRNYDQENALVDAALAMRAETLLDVAVMLRLAWRVLDIEVCSEYDEKEFQKAGRQIENALLTSIAVIVKETGLSVSETLGYDVERFLACDSADAGLGDGL